jgi:hypothetical protein
MCRIGVINTFAGKWEKKNGIIIIQDTMTDMVS